MSVGGLDSSTVFSGTIQDAVSLTKDGGGTLTLSGANIYTGATTVTAGTLLAAATGAIPAASSLVVETAGTLDLGGFSQTVAALSGNGIVTNSGLSGAVLTVGATTPRRPSPASFRTASTSSG